MDFHTVAGFALTMLGRIPSAAERFEWQGFLFEIMDMDGHRIDKVLISASAGSSDTLAQATEKA